MWANCLTVGMPDNSTILSRVRRLHQALILAGCEEKTIPKESFDKLICQMYDLNPLGVRNYLDTGRSHGLWTYVSKEGRGPKGNLPRIVSVVAGLKIHAKPISLLSIQEE